MKNEFKIVQKTVNFEEFKQKDWIVRGKIRIEV